MRVNVLRVSFSWFLFFFSFFSSISSSSKKDTPRGFFLFFSRSRRHAKQQATFLATAAQFLSLNPSGQLGFRSFSPPAVRTAGLAFSRVGFVNIEGRNTTFRSETRLETALGLSRAETAQTASANGGAVPAEAAPHARACCAPSPSSCLAVFVEIAGGNRVRCYSTTIDLVVIINHTGRFARVFAHACAYTTARPHDRTTARPHDRTTARPHDRTTTAKYRGVSGVCQAVSPQNGQPKRETQTGNKNAFAFRPSMFVNQKSTAPAELSRFFGERNGRKPHRITAFRPFLSAAARARTSASLAGWLASIVARSSEIVPTTATLRRLNSREVGGERSGSRNERGRSARWLVGVTILYMWRTKRHGHHCE